MQQCARLSKDPIKPHGEDVKRIRRYLKGTDKMGIYIRSFESKFKVWYGDYFGGNWFPEEYKDDSYMARYCSGFVV